MKNILRIAIVVLTLLSLLISVSAVGKEATYNPWTGKQDWVWDGGATELTGNLNISDNNLTNINTLKFSFNSLIQSITSGWLSTSNISITDSPGTTSHLNLSFDGTDSVIETGTGDIELRSTSNVRIYDGSVVALDVSVGGLFTQIISSSGRYINFGDGCQTSNGLSQSDDLNICGKLAARDVIFANDGINVTGNVTISEILSVGISTDPDTLSTFFLGPFMLINSTHPLQLAVNDTFSVANSVGAVKVKVNTTSGFTGINVTGDPVYALQINGTLSATNIVSNNGSFGFTGSCQLIGPLEIRNGIILSCD